MTIASQQSGAATMTASTRTQVFSLGKANLLDYMIQLILPMVLVRLLDTTEFGQYRMLWLIANAVIALGQLHMPQSLLYLLPRESPERVRLYINNTLLFLATTGLFAIAVVGPWNVWLPGKMEHISSNSWFVPLFVFTWLIASLIEFLPNADQRIAWQAQAIIGLSLLRATTLIMIAVMTRDIEWVFAGLLLFAVIKLILLYYYIARYHGLKLFRVDKTLLKSQVNYATPFGLSGSLYTLRGQADQWVVAALFSTTAFAAFSIAYVFSPLANIIRQSVNSAVMPRMSGLHANGEYAELLRLNSKANAASNFLLFPMLVFFFVFATQIVELVYTSAYIQAADVMRIYLVGMLAISVEVNSLLRVFSQGRFSLKLNFLLLLVSALVSYLGARSFGLWGGAFGSVLTLIAGELLNLRRAAKMMQVPLGKFLPWGQLSKLLAAAVMAGILAKGVALLPVVKAYVLAQLFAGAAIMALAYLLLVMLLGNGDMIRELRSEVMKRRSQRQ